jgi:hypothetical protein
MKKEFEEGSVLEKEHFVVFTKGFGKALIANAARGIKGSTIESHLNSDSGEELHLDIAKLYVFKNGEYLSVDHPYGSPTLNTDDIALIYSPDSKVLYNRDDGIAKNQVSLLWDFNNRDEFFSHRLIGEVAVKGSAIPRLKKDPILMKLRDLSQILQSFLILVLLGILSHFII